MSLNSTSQFLAWEFLSLLMQQVVISACLKATFIFGIKLVVLECASSIKWERGEAMSLQKYRMFSLFSVLAFILGVSGSDAWAKDPRPGTEMVPITDVFSPLGFDSNDDTQVIVSGYLPSMCYKSPQVKAQVVGKEIRLTVTALKECDPNEYCIPALVPFVEPVSLGVMDKGNYKVVANIGSEFQKESEITVVESTSSAIDDYIYANVRYVETMTGTRQAYLRGENPSPCFELDHIEWVSNGNDTYSVLPIMKQVSELCPQQMTPFKYPIEIPTELDREYMLLHVRTMNGKSVNHLWGKLPYWKPSRGGSKKLSQR